MRKFFKRRFWYVVDHWESFYVVPVRLVARRRGLGWLVVWELGEGFEHEYWVAGRGLLHRKREDAEVAAYRMNVLANLVISNQ